MTANAPRIVQVEISSVPRPKPLGLFDPTPPTPQQRDGLRLSQNGFVLGSPAPVVTVTFDDNSRKELFSFYPDEIRFDLGELVGLTEAEAHALRHRNDLAYLRAP